MVQRIVANKFGVQSGGVKGEKRVASFKTTSSSSSSSSSSQNPDGKNRAADLKKMRKKSRAIQLSDFEITLASSPIRKNVSLPGKPPPNSSNVLEIKQKQNQASVIRTSDGSPNYMKSTSCFDARKEVSQVSSRNSRIFSDSKKPRRKNLENSTHGSVAGLKPTKCLTKSSSMKLVRTLKKTPSFKKSSRVALCADMDSQRATCSSTLKDSKFPAYLMLSPGATEYEGTSAMKVCPYSYCSLNGHRHAPLPPLKCFLSARRHSLKTQNKRKVDPSGCGVKEVIDAGGEALDEEMVNDGGLDFFLEIYAENKVDGAGTVDQDRVMSGDCAGVSSSTVGDEAESSNEEDNKPVEENISDGSMDPEVGLGEEVTEGMFFHGDEYEDDAGSTDTEMEEWEEQQFLSMESDGLDEFENQSNAGNGGLSEETCLQNGELAGSGDFANKKSGDFEEQLYIENSDLNRHPDWEVEEASQVSESLSFDQHSYLEDEFDEKDATLAVSERAEIEYLEMILDYELEAEVAETSFTTQEASNNEQEKQDLQVDNSKVSDEEQSGIHEEVLQFDCQLPNNDLVLHDELLYVDINNQMESEKQLDDSNHGDEVAVEAESSEKCVEAHVSDGQCQDISTTGNKNSVAGEAETESSTVLEMTGNEEHSDLKMEETSFNDNSIVPVDIVGGKDRADSSVKAAKFSRTAIDSSQVLDLLSKNWEVNAKCRLGDESEDPRDFNPREPNYLPLVPDPEAEKVDLKHQLMDDRKNAEEWMLDYALQQTVTKLAPAKKKKVALLVEAFESVMPTSRYEIHLRNNASGAFTQAKRIQACF